MAGELISTTTYGKHVSIIFKNAVSSSWYTYVLRLSKLIGINIRKTREHRTVMRSEEQNFKAALHKNDKHLNSLSARSNKIIIIGNNLECIITAIISDGRGAFLKRHIQLFRVTETSSTYPFIFKIVIDDTLWSYILQMYKKLDYCNYEYKSLELNLLKFKKIKNFQRGETYFNSVAIEQKFPIEFHKVALQLIAEKTIVPYLHFMLQQLMTELLSETEHNKRQKEIEVDELYNRMLNYGDIIKNDTNKNV